jgi:hypothetical protein
MFRKRPDNEHQAVRPTMSQAIDKYFFLKDADRRMTAVIEPVMKDISKKLQSHGHESAIVRESQSISQSGNLQHRHISLIILPRNRKPANLAKCPAIAFVANSDKKTVWVREKTMVSNRSRERTTGEYQLREITWQLVENHILDFLPETLRRTAS